MSYITPVTENTRQLHVDVRRYLALSAFPDVKNKLIKRKSVFFLLSK